jgi:3-hydroxyacyl-[acyl-carrier-protein] dehydratase
MDKVRFKRVVSPGDQLVYTVELTKQKQDFWKFTGQAHVKKELAVQVGSLLATAKKA